MKQWRIGLVGLGAVAEVHLSAYKQLPNVTIVAGADVSAFRRKWATDSHNIETFEDYRDMLAKQTLDLVCVLTPASKHKDVVRQVAECGLPVLCEKPLAASLQDAEEIIRVAKEHGVDLFYGASYRFLPALVKAREIVLSGKIGRVLYMSEDLIGGSGIENRTPLSEVHYPKGGPGGSGMGLVDHGIHLLDYFQWLMDEPATSVFGQGCISGEAPKTEYAIVNFASGAVARLTYQDSTFATTLPSEGTFGWGGAWDIEGYVPPGGWHANPGEVHIYGTQGALRVRHYAQHLYLFTGKGSEKVAVTGDPAPGHFATQMSTILSELDEGKRPSVPGTVGLEAIRILFAIYESMKAHRVIDVRLE